MIGDPTIEAWPARREIVVIGCGSIGLPLAAALASRGCRVLGYDTNAPRVAALSDGRIETAEDGLAAATRAALATGALRFAAALDRASGPRAFILAVPTPATADEGFDGRPIDAALTSAAEVALDRDLVCIRATVPIGTTTALSAAYPRLLFASCPDRTLSGLAFVEQFEVPHLVGGVTGEAAAAASALFARLGRVVRVHDAETAEAIKLFANVQRDCAFALANQFALLCEAAGVDFHEVRTAGAEEYPRFALPRPGPVGGPCLSKDVHVLAASRGAAGLDLRLLLKARRLNEGLAGAHARQILERLGASQGPVAVLGLAFKGTPPTLDVRDGYAAALVVELKRARPGIVIRLWDPMRAGSLPATLSDAAIIVLANDHPALAGMLDEARHWAPGAALFDLTGVLGEDIGEAPGVEVHRFGNGRARP